MNFDPDILKVCIGATATITAAIITGIATYKAAKSHDQDKGNKQWKLDVLENVIKPIWKYSSYEEMILENADTVLFEINQLSEKFYDYYTWLPPEATASMRMLLQDIRKSDTLSLENKKEIFQKDIVPKYKNIRFMMTEYEKLLRKETECPEENIYEFFRYHIGNPIIVSIFVIIGVLFWIVAVFTLLIIYNQSNLAYKVMVAPYVFIAVWYAKIFISYKFKKHRFNSSPKKSKANNDNTAENNE